MTCEKSLPAEFQRDEEISRRINEFFARAFRMPPDDYYSRLTLTDILSLKSALSDINNAITMQLTLHFVEWVGCVLSMDLVTRRNLRAAVLASKPSSNGYDVWCEKQPRFIAEVKCNIPINGGNKYGADQRTGIFKDIDALLSGKTKGMPITEPTLKFMVFLDIPAVREANNHLLKSAAALSKKLELLADGEQPFNANVVYIVHIPVGNFQPLRRSSTSVYSKP
ncbi:MULTISPECIES: hypothetical protein [Massilia]|uniref:hypothetical protein n=1 Tax=Massilia TaxID=149698 RepID=UPI00279678B4|nr:MULTISPECIES: hypothetical protein [unclassified Massilia]MDQ1835499.1 hypothetical protein [Massilia sp. CCM 9029]MDQ1925117.1 hypothetical protein [Massilia sp. CCM 9206]